MGGWAHVLGEFRLWRERAVGRKRFGLEFPQPVHVGVTAVLCAGSFANLLVLALFAILTGLGAEFLVAFGGGAVAATVFVRWFLQAHQANLWQDIESQTKAAKQKEQQAQQVHLAAIEKALARLLGSVGADAYQKLERVYLAKHRIDATRRFVATHEPLDLPSEQSQACDELIRLVMLEASNVLHSAPVIQVFRKFPQIPRIVYWEICDAYADNNRY